MRLSSSEVLSMMRRSNSKVVYSWLVWSEASVSPSLHVGLSSGLLELPPTWWLASPQMSDPRVQGGSKSGFYDLTAEVTHHHGRHILLVTKASSDSVWEKTLQRHKQQKPRRIGGHLGGWLPHMLPPSHR